jgi:hypothetical protein
MFEWDSVFARHEKFDRSALAKARDMGSSARTDPAAADLAKLPAKAEIAEKDVFAQILFLWTVTGNVGTSRPSLCAKRQISRGDRQRPDRDQGPPG